MRPLTKGEDPDENPHDAAFQKDLQRVKSIFFLKIIACYSSIYTIDRPRFNVLNQICVSKG